MPKSHKGESTKKSYRDGLTLKQRAWTKKMLENPKMNGTEVALQTYNTTNRGSANQISHRNLNNPLIQVILSGADNEAQESILKVMRTSTGLRKDSRHAEVALKAAQDVQDRLHGKAKQQIDIQSTMLNITLDLTGGNAGPVPKEILEELEEITNK